jgi:hypothetical protein
MCDEFVSFYIACVQMLFGAKVVPFIFEPSSKSFSLEA